MNADWSPLHAEFDRWREAARRIPFWWRDDDAVEPTAALDRLLGLSDALELPVHLAVIPADASDGLARRLEGTQARVLTHGWAHENHAPQSEKKAEFRDHRSAEAMRDELVAGFERVSERFGAAFRPVFVPPWNRVSEGVIAMLPEVGYAAVSVFNARRTGFEINTHIDPIDWRGTRSCVAPERLIALTVDVLKARRLGETDAEGLFAGDAGGAGGVWGDFEELTP